MEIWKCTHIMHVKQHARREELWSYGNVPTLCTSNKNTNVPTSVFSNDIHGGRSYGAMEMYPHYAFLMIFTEGGAMEMYPHYAL